MAVRCFQVTKPMAGKVNSLRRLCAFGAGRGPSGPHGLHGAVARAGQCRWFAATVGADFEKQLMPEDILHLRALSMTIMQDPICEIRPEEAQRYLVDVEDPIGDLPIWHPKRMVHQVFDPFRSRK